MNREQLEAAIWRNLPGADAQSVDEILSAADAYVATTLGEIDHARRTARNGREYAMARRAAS